MRRFPAETPMFGGLRAWLLRMLRVPAEPRPPASDQHVVRIFRAAPNYWRYKVVLWLLTQIGASLGVITSLIFAEGVAATVPFESLRFLILAFESIAVSIF